MAPRHRPIPEKSRRYLVSARAWWRIAFTTCVRKLPQSAICCNASSAPARAPTPIARSKTCRRSTHISTCTMYFAFQAEGEKLWHVYDARADNPIAPMPPGDEAEKFLVDSRGKLLFEAPMQPGDLLYSPRGQYHDAITGAEASLHITYWVKPATGLSLFRLLEFRRRIGKRVQSLPSQSERCAGAQGPLGPPLPAFGQAHQRTLLCHRYPASSTRPCKLTSGFRPTRAEAPAVLFDRKARSGRSPA